MFYCGSWSVVVMVSIKIPVKCNVRQKKNKSTVNAYFWNIYVYVQLLYLAIFYIYFLPGKLHRERSSPKPKISLSVHFLVLWNAATQRIHVIILFCATFCPNKKLLMVRLANICYIIRTKMALKYKQSGGARTQYNKSTAKKYIFHRDSKNGRTHGRRRPIVSRKRERERHSRTGVVFSRLSAEKRNKHIFSAVYFRGSFGRSDTLGILPITVM